MATGVQAYYLEGPASPTRSEAARVARVASAAGMRARVVRRYRHGQGWEYVARVEGLAEREEAERLASELATRAGAPVRVFWVEGEQARSVAHAPVSEPQPEPDATTARMLLAETVRAHGGPEGGLAAVEGADSVLLRYRRHLPGGGEVLHTWARSGEARYLEVVVEEGEGVDSRLLATNDGAWLARGGTVQPQDREAALRQLQRFGPRAVLGLSLVVGASPQDAARPGEPLKAPELPQCLGLTLVLHTGARHDVCIDPQSHHLLAARSGELVRVWSGYRELDLGVVVPEMVRTNAGELELDRLEILALDLQPDLPAEWFSVADLK